MNLTSKAWVHHALKESYFSGKYGFPNNEDQDHGKDGEINGVVSFHPPGSLRHHGCSRPSVVRLYRRRSLVDDPLAVITRGYRRSRRAVPGAAP